MTRPNPPPIIPLLTLARILTAHFHHLPLQSLLGYPLSIQPAKAATSLARALLHFLTPYPILPLACHLPQARLDRLLQAPPHPALTHILAHLHIAFPNHSCLCSHPPR